MILRQVDATILDETQGPQRPTSLMLLHMGFGGQIPWTSNLSSIKWGDLTATIMGLISVIKKTYPNKILLILQP